MRLSVDIKSVTLGKKEILRNIAFAPDDNSFTAVIGKNGSGKSTLLEAISGGAAYDGSVLVNGMEVIETDVRTLSRNMSKIPQNILKPHIRVEDLISYGRNPYRKIFAGKNAEDEAIVSDAIHISELDGIRKSYLDSISGGELRRAYFAMMLAQNTDIALLDEATAFMDADFERKFVTMQKELSKSKTVISVMHNLTLAVAFADNVLLLDGGSQKFYGTPDELLESDLIESTFFVKRYISDGIIFFA